MTIGRGSVIWLFALVCLGRINAQDLPDVHLPRIGSRLPLVAVGPQAAAPDDPQPDDPQPDDPQPDDPQPSVPPPPVRVRALDSARGGEELTVRLVVGQGRILTTESPIVNEGDVAVIAVGDPTVVDFEVLPNPRMLRLTGKRPGVTDLTLVTSDERTLIYEIHVEYDVRLVEARLRESFPGALVKISQLGTHVILEGQARDQRQVVMIENTVRAFLDSMQVSGPVGGVGGRDSATANEESDGLSDQSQEQAPDLIRLLRALPEATPRPQQDTSGSLEIINLISLPGVQQVMLQVRIAELNRTAMREIGADTFFEWGPGNILGTQVSSATAPKLQTGDRAVGPDLGATSTGFGIFPTGRIEIILKALRTNSLVRVLAEPNLVALSGHEASFLAGGEFPVPVARGDPWGPRTLAFNSKNSECS